MNTIYILWLRQLKRYLRSKARIVGSAAQPLLFLVALGFGFGPIYERAGGGNYIQFLAPGIIAMSILFTAVFSGIDVIWDRQFGFLKETLVAPVSRFLIMLGRTAGGATVATLQGVIVFLISLIAGFRPVSILGVLLSIVIMFLVALLFTALGTAIGSMLQDMQGFQLIMNFVVMPTFFLSGALFPLQGLPTVVTWVALADPLSYGVDALRTFLVQATHFGIVLDLAVLGAAVFALVALGGWLFSRVEA
ncbi:MAG TPA: ABC transporter permease [Patescibacteria group bacterium]|nr:ABC transporter permease [Patescibacteria group bacterium]